MDVEFAEPGKELGEVFHGRVTEDLGLTVIGSAEPLGQMRDQTREFFQRFRELNVHSSEQLDQLVEQSQRILRGIEPQSLRDNTNVRQNVAVQLSAVQSVIDGLMVDRPRRNILRRPR